MNVIRMRRSSVIALCAFVSIVTSLLYYLTLIRLGNKVESSDARKWTGRRQFPNSSLSLMKQVHSSKMSMADLSSVWTFQPDFTLHFDGGRTYNRSKTTDPFIPRIIHQVWDTTNVPVMFSKWIPTWLARNPGWQHWLWTLDDVRDLIARHYSEHLTLYDSYTAPVFRADVMRYFVLHRYGGVYVDLDMESLRPLDDWTFNFHCVVSEENYEHSFVIREQQSTNLVNGFIACAPRHPFLELVIDSLDEAAMKYFGDYLYATGPMFFDSAWRRYDADPSNRVASSSSRGVVVLPPFYFLPTYDPSESDLISGRCAPSKFRSLPPKSQIVCRELGRRSFHNSIHQLAYANHYWIHAYMFDEGWKASDARPVFEFAPRVQTAYMAVRHWEAVV